MTYRNQKPFWESDEEIDVGIISDILVVIHRYIPEDDSISVFQTCLEQSQSCAVKMCAVRALTLLSIEVARVNFLTRYWAHIPYSEAQVTLAAFIDKSTGCLITSRPLRSHCMLCTFPPSHSLQPLVC